MLLWPLRYGRHVAERVSFPLYQATRCAERCAGRGSLLRACVCARARQGAKRRGKQRILSKAYVCTPRGAPPSCASPKLGVSGGKAGIVRARALLKSEREGAAGKGGTTEKEGGRARSPVLVIQG